MARRIQNPEDAVSEGASDQVPPAGVTFIKNQVNELITLDNGQKYKFPASSITTNDADLIAQLRLAADRKGNPHGIFEASTPQP